MAKSKELKLYENALERLSRKQEYFKRFENIWDWIARELEEVVDIEIKYLEYLKTAIIQKYWEQEVFISPTALDEIIFYCLQSYSKDELVDRINEQIKDSHLDKNSIVIFPVNAFGFRYGGLSKIFGNLSHQYQYGNFKIISQTNSFKISKANVIQYLKDNKIPNLKKMDQDLFRHYHVSRNLQWFTKNPMMLIHFNFSQRERYDNLNFIIEKINFVTNKLYFISSLAGEEDRIGSLFSTRNTNNWETLDIRHLLTITSSKNDLTLNCIPMHFKRFRSDEMMHLNIDLLIKKKKGIGWHKRAIQSIDKLYEGYMKFLLTKNARYLIYITGFRIPFYISEEVLNLQIERILL